MGQTTIEWTSYRKPDGTIVPGYTANPVIGCAKKSPGCKFCYAENDTPARVARAGGQELWGVDASRKVTKSWLTQAKAWNLAARVNNEQRLVFCASQADWLEDREEWLEPRAQLLKTIFETPNLIWLLLSKEPWNFDHLVYQAFEYWNLRGDNTDVLIAKWRAGSSIPSNVRLGVSVENQEWADKRREAFAKLPGSKFVSYEPALGPVNWDGWEFVDQIISGGESGKDKDKDIRPSHLGWHRRTRDWCRANRKAYFFKQWGEWLGTVQGQAPNVPTGTPVHHFDGGLFLSLRLGKLNTGNMLDGRQHLEIPGINFFSHQEVA